MEQLVADRLLPLNPVSGAPAWISPLPEETVIVNLNLN